MGNVEYHILQTFSDLVEEKQIFTPYDVIKIARKKTGKALGDYKELRKIIIGNKNNFLRKYKETYSAIVIRNRELKTFVYHPEFLDSKDYDHDYVMEGKQKVEKSENFESKRFSKHFCLEIPARFVKKLDAQPKDILYLKKNEDGIIVSHEKGYSFAKIRVTNNQRAKIYYNAIISHLSKELQALDKKEIIFKLCKIFLIEDFHPSLSKIEIKIK